MFFNQSREQKRFPFVQQIRIRSFEAGKLIWQLLHLTQRKGDLVTAEGFALHLYHSNYTGRGPRLVE